MRRFDVACLTGVEDTSSLRRSAKFVRRLRSSQSVFALALNVSTSLVSQWERGEKKPERSLPKLLALARNKGIEAIRRCCSALQYLRRVDDDAEAVEADIAALAAWR